MNPQVFSFDLLITLLRAHLTSLVEFVAINELTLGPVLI